MLKLFFLIFVVDCLFLLFANPYWLRIASSALLLSSLSYAHNLLFYFLGYPAFGGIAFFGLGAYTFSFLYSKGFPLIPSLFLSMLIPSLFALILLPIMLRLKSHYFAISTLALQVMLMELVENIELFGGTKGYALNLSHHANIIAYYLFLLALLGLFLFTILLERSLFGRTLKAIKEDETASLTLGINPMSYKLSMLLLMGMSLGLLGGAFSIWSAYIDASTVFNPILSVKTFFVLILSLNSPVYGPFLWSLFFEMFFETLWSNFPQVHGILLGLGIMLLILAFPRGLKWKRS
jgi:branched-chain amino acid transport system permease protein